ncbi:hypothetical protein F4779DRAFT_615130 [Xylariaceae sp. FL0662B]|nr:hypothetical protein F4779DRAFT_615130 [Xylariaceae sp. FL0662B]
MFGKTRIPPYAAPAAGQVGKRQYVEQDGRLIWFWYTKEGVIIKWVLFLSFILLIGLYLVLGRVHAKRRLRKGMKPMAYHAWLLSRQERARVDPQYAWPQASYTNYNHNQAGPDYYGMHNMPPPVYDPNRPPMYEGGPPPMGGGKVDPAAARTSNDYAPPPGPPPPAAAMRP